MNIIEIINKKRKKEELNDQEIKYVIDGFLSGEIKDYQISSLLMAILLNDMTNNEINSLTKYMAESGNMLDLTRLGLNVVDKHSTGGVGDKVTIILIPVIAALGYPVAKISSKGYGISGGTIDKLESIPGFDADINLNEFKELVKKVGAGIINQNFNLAPAEGKMYKLRNQIACQD